MRPLHWAPGVHGWWFSPSPKGLRQSRSSRSKYHTACITCHTVFPKLNNVGEAFRRNGYQFPSDEEVLVKEEPVKMGVDSYKNMFPNSIWPSSLPSIPPVSLFTYAQNVVNLQPHGQEKTWDMAFPADIELLGAGTFGKDISTFWDVGFASSGAGFAGDGAGFSASVGRVFVQFSNLFAWEPEEDDDGAHLGNCWAVLPPHALNLRIGKIDPAVLPHVISEETLPFAQAQPLPASFVFGANANTGNPGTGFSLFAEQPAIEINGIVNQYWSYAVGIANGGSAVNAAFDDNTFKDVYFRVSRKWFGYPLDGVLGKVEQDGKNAPPAEQADDSVYKTPGLDFWRTVGFETGVFGWFGKSFVPDSLAVPPTVPPTINPVNVSDPTTFGKDYFERIGVDARLQYFDLDLYGFAFYGHDPFPGFNQSFILANAVDHYGFFVESDYMFKPWITGFLRYEQVWINNSGFSTEARGAGRARSRSPDPPEPARVERGLYPRRQHSAPGEPGSVMPVDYGD